MTIFNKRTW